MTAIQKAREALVANGFDTRTLAIADEFMPEAGGRDKAALQIAILDAAAAALAALDAETPTTPADVGEEPVAWQWRSKGWSVDDKWSEWLWGRKPPERKFDPHDYEERPLYSATALERVVRERDEARAWSERHHADLVSAEAKLAEARKVIERYESGLNTLATTFYKDDQHQDYAKHVLDIRNLEPRHD